MMITRNPEILRFSWMEFSLTRLILMPLVIGIAVFIASSYERPLEAVSLLSYSIFVMLAVVWGGHKAAQSVLEEINDNTWDFQRLSSLSPHSMVLGKWFGSTIYCWYGALMALAVYAAVGPSLFSTSQFYYNLILMLASALLCQGIALFSSLQSLHMRIASRGKMRVFGHQVVGIVAGLCFLSAVIGAGEGRRHRAPLEIYWYEQAYGWQGFIACLAVVVFLWSLAGSYWQMRTHLRMRTGPWMWLAFLLFMIGLVCGFGRGQDAIYSIPALAPGIAFGLSLLSLYAMALLEPWNIVSYRRWLERWRLGDRAAIAEQCPRWLVSLLLTAISLAVTTVFHWDKQIPLVLLVFFVFALRDMAVLHYTRLFSRRKRATAAALFYAALYYLLAPMLLRAAGLDAAANLFAPLAREEHTQTLIMAIIFALVQIGLLFLWCHRLWKRQDEALRRAA